MHHINTTSFPSVPIYTQPFSYTHFIYIIFLSLYRTSFFFQLLSPSRTLITMEGSSTDDQRTTTEATSIVATLVTMPPLIDSGGSMVLDTNEAGLEASFLSSHSKAEIVDMLRKHTYNDELEQS